VNRSLMMILATAAAAFSLQAQTANPLVAELKMAYTNTKTKFTKLAEKMPDDGYNFKATPEVRPFGANIAHIADSQLRACSSVNGEQKTGTAGTKTAKADILAALKESFAECDKAWDSITDPAAMTTGARPRTKLGALAGNTVHVEEEYGYNAVYLRLKGIVPPSSEGR
jgi:hypothetical protein